MNPRTLLASAALLVVVTLSGCGGPAAKLYGKWQMAANAGEGNALLKMMASSMKGELEFRGDGSLTMAVKTPLGDKSTTGNWRFVKAEGNALILAVKTADVAERETRLEFTDNDHFSMVPFDAMPDAKGMKLDFTRIK